MKIVSAAYDPFGSIIVVVEDQPPDTFICVPDDMENRDRLELAEWAAAGNTISPYVPPPVEAA